MKGIMRPLKGCSTHGLVILEGYFATITSGTIDTTSGTSYDPGFSVTKTASEAGRYTITLDRKSYRFAGGIATVIGADDTAYTTAKGLDVLWRDDDIATDGTIELQFVRSDTAADAELENSAKVKLILFIVDTDT